MALSSSAKQSSHLPSGIEGGILTQPESYQLLTRNGMNSCTITCSIQDMSVRRYFRIKDQPYLLMESTARMLSRYMYVAHLLRQAGINVPTIYDHTASYALIEDWGDSTLTNLIRNGSAPQPLLQSAMDILLKLHQCFAPQSKPKQGLIHALPTYTMSTFLQEVLLFPRWWPTTALSRQAITSYQNIFQHLHQMCEDALHTTLVLKDYHMENIMLTPQHTLGVIDFQDALMGPYLYDVVSLLEDARIDIPSNVRDHALQYYRINSGLSPHQWEKSMNAYHVWGVGRHLKIIGVFMRYAKRHGNKSKLIHLPRLKGYVKQKLKQPILSPLRQWVEQWASEYAP